MKITRYRAKGCTVVDIETGEIVAQTSDPRFARAEARRLNDWYNGEEA
jgi:hypothetical protein